MNSENIHKFTDCIGKSYETYPVFTEMFHGNYNADTVSKIFEFSLKGSEEMITYSTDYKIYSSVSFASPKFTGSSVSQFIRSGGISFLMSMGYKKVKFLNDYEKYCISMKKKYTGNDAWYLFSLTVLPEMRNKNLASEAVKPMFAYLDRIGKVCYLETHKESNVAMYEHFGFEVAEATKLPGTEVEFYSMVRNPRK